MGDPEDIDGGVRGLLRPAALVAAVAGAGGSVGLTLRAGQWSHSHVAVVLVALWVLAPLMALMVANIVSKGWPALTQATLHGVTLVLALSSLAVYGEFGMMPSGAPRTFVFVIVPPVSWLLMTTVMSAAAVISRKR